MVFKNIDFHNVEEIFEKEDGLQLSRIPENVRVFLNENAKIRSFMPAGCELRFNLKSEKAKIYFKKIKNVYKNVYIENGICEVYFGDFFYFWYFIDENGREIEVKYPENIDKLKKIAEEKKLSFDPEVIRVILPHRCEIRIINIEGEFEIPKPNQIPKLKYLSYGSSITQGASSIRPTGTYPMKTAQILGVDLINLGFGGGAYLEKEIADYIAERNDWDFATFELGINMVLWSDVEEFEKRVNYFVETIVRKHSDKYLYFIDMFPFFMDFEKEKKQEEFRKIVRNKVKEIDKENVIYISGFELLKSEKGLTFDLVHPASFGMEEIAFNLSTIISHTYFKK